jgi:hypothetical protein
MPRRLAATLSLLVFAICLIAGMQSGNPLATVLSRGLVAMAGTMVISLIVGTMAQRMLEENLRQKERDLRQSMAGGVTDSPPAGGPPPPNGRPGGQ